jgi:hypothetical protein
MIISFFAAKSKAARSEHSPWNESAMTFVSGRVSPTYIVEFGSELW